MALNTELRSDDSERRNWEATMMALNVELKTDDGDSEPQNWKMRLWTSNWKSMMALNAETKNAMMMALNAETENATLNVKLKMWW